MGDKAESVNPLTAGFKKIPGLSVLLPTKAILYNSEQVKESVLRSGEIHIHPMSAKDELILKSPDLLLNGEAFRMVVRRCIPEILEPLDLYQPDVDAVMIGLRIVTYGEELAMRVDNPFYDREKEGSQRELDYSINLKPVLSQSKFAKDKKEFMTVLENKQVVTMAPIRFREGIEIIQADLNELNIENKEEIFEKRLQIFEDTMLAMILEVDGITDKKQLKEWLGGMPVSMFKAISEKVDFLASLGPNLITKIKDPITNETWEVSLPINPADFFAFGPSRVTLSGFLNTQTS